jgi:phosphohistidine phosphatase SixA
MKKPETPHSRRALLALLGAGAAALTTSPARAGTADVRREVADRLRGGGVVIALRHTLAPGTFDPPGFRVDDCSTQRNLSDEGRAQARRIGQWFERERLVPGAVRSSPWCRCLDTARGAFGRAESWAALGSPAGQDEAARQAQVSTLRAALAEVSRKPGFQVWVTHMFVLQALAGENTDSGEALVLRADGARVQTLARAILH